MVQRYPGGQPVGYEPVLDGTEVVSVWGRNPNDANKPRTLSQQTTTQAIADLSGQVINVMAYGAKGDGVTDDTIAIQAALDAGFAGAINVYFPKPAFYYRISAGLTVGTDASAGRLVRGWRVFGDGPGDGDGLGGSPIRLFGTAIDAILTVNSGVWRYCDFSDFCLQLDIAASATYGLLFKSTEFSQHTVRRVGIAGIAAVNAITAFAILIGTGANGEFILFEDVFANNVGNFFYSNAGQAYVQSFVHARNLNMASGGVHFHLAPVDVGGGLDILDFNGGCQQIGGISNSTLLLDEGNASCINMIGGRVEHVTQVYNGSAQSIQVTPNIRIQGMEIVCDFDPTNGALAFSAAITNANPGTGLSGAGVFLVDHVQFQADNGNVTFPVNWEGGGWNVTKFRDSIWWNFARPPYVIGSESAVDVSVEFEACRANGIAATTGDRHAVFPFDRHIDAQQLSPGIRSVRGDSAWTQAGLPENQITNPQLANANGGGLPLAPWVLVNSSGIDFEDWNGTRPPRSSSPWARTFVLPSSVVLYQDITAADLSSGAIAKYSIDGIPFSYITWQLLINELAGTTTGKFELLNNIDGTVYDSREFKTSGSPIWPRIITLSAAIRQLGSTSYPQIRITNAGANDLIVDMSWQFVGVNFNSALGALSAAALTQESVVSAQLILTEPANLAYMADSYGSAAVNPLPNLSGKIYMSSTDHKLTFHDGTAWRKL